MNVGRWLLAAVLVTAVAPAVAPAVALAAAAAAAAAEPRNLQVMSWNMCGSQRSTWHCEGTGTPQQKVDVVRYHVDTNRVRAALLQEVCEDDLALLMSQLGTGWSRSFQPYQWSQDGVRTDSRCGNDDGRADRIGTAIVVKGNMVDPRPYPTSQPWTGQHRPFHCATAGSWNVRLCNLHLSPLGSNPDHPEWEYADDQLAEIKEIVSGFPTVVFGGDLNVTPPDQPGNERAWLWPDGLYATGDGTAGYRECDQVGAARVGRPTHEGGWKLDYLFSSEPRRWCAVESSAYSDHYVIIESVSVA